MSTIQWLWLVLWVVTSVFFYRFIAGYYWPFNGLYRWLKGSLNYHLNRKAMLDDHARLEEALLVSCELCEAIRKQRQVADNRIAELEQQLAENMERREELNNGIQAVLNFINSDRQKFRSPTNQHVRELLEEVRRGEPEVDKDRVFSWAIKHVK